MLTAAAISALVLSSAAQASSQGTGIVALGVEAYARSKTDCIYRPEVGPVLKQMEDFYSEEGGDEWEAARAKAPRQFVVATNIVIISGATADGGGPVSRCGFYGSAVGQALLLSAGVLRPDRAILAEANRLIEEGAPPREGIAARAEAPQIPQGSSGYFANGAGTNMGPGYRSTHGRPAGAVGPASADAPVRSAPGVPHGRLSYGGRAAIELDITGVSGLDTEHAMIGFHQSRANAVAACIGLEKAASPQCVTSLLARPFRNAVYANCRSGVIVDLYGQKYRFEGPTPPQSEEGGNAKYRVEDLASGEILMDTTADGYRTVMRLYQDLCPVTAPSDQ